MLIQFVQAALNDSVFTFFSIVVALKILTRDGTFDLIPTIMLSVGISVIKAGLSLVWEDDHGQPGG